MAASLGQWTPPLPPGWEARWDANQRAYFYINHQNRNTTWADPRPAFYQSQQQPQQSSTGQASAAAQKQRHHHPRPRKLLNQTDFTSDGDQGISLSTLGSSSAAPWYETESKKSETGLSNIQIANLEKIEKLKRWFPECPEKVIRHALEKEKNNVGIACFELQKRGYKNVNLEPTSVSSPSHNTDKVQAVQAMFPSAGSNLIQDVLSGCGYDIEETKSLLEKLGYHPVSSSDTNQHLSTPKGGGGRAKSPKRTTTSTNQRSVSPKPAASKPKVSEHKKKELKIKFEKEFKSLPHSVVHMALESCDYNEDTAKRLLELNEQDMERSKSQASSRPFSGSSTASSATTSSMFSTPSYKTNMQLEPVIFGADVTPKKKTEPAKSTKPVVKTGKAHQKTKNVTPSKMSTVPSTSRTATPKSSPHKAADKTKINQVTRMSEQLLNKTNDVLNHLAGTCCAKLDDDDDTERLKVQQQDKSTVSKQPPRYESLYRTIPKGPDPNNRSGPDSSLLQPKSTLAQGPDPENHVGPAVGLVQGSQGAVGPDVTLRCGPQSSFLQTRDTTQYDGILITQI